MCKMSIPTLKFQIRFSLNWNNQFGRVFGETKRAPGALFVVKLCIVKFCIVKLCAEKSCRYLAASTVTGISWLPVAQGIDLM